MEVNGGGEREERGESEEGREKRGERVKRGERRGVYIVTLGSFAHGEIDFIPFSPYHPSMLASFPGSPPYMQLLLGSLLHVYTWCGVGV